MRYGIKNPHGQWCFGPTVDEDAARARFDALGGDEQGYTWHDVPDAEARQIQKGMASGLIDHDLPEREES